MSNIFLHFCQNIFSTRLFYFVPTMSSEDLPSKADTPIPEEYKASDSLKSEAFPPDEPNSKNETTENENKAPSFQEDNISVHIDFSDFARRSKEIEDYEIDENLEQVRRESIKSAFEDFAATIRTSLDPSETASIATSDIVVPEASALRILSGQRDCTVSASQPRFQNHNDDQSISKLFVQTTDDIQSLRTLTSSQSSFALVSSKSEREERQSFDREHYYNAYTMCKQQQTAEQTRNNYLQRRIFDYFRKRKMYHVLVKDADENALELKKKYECHLDELDILKERAQVEKIKITLELDSLMKLHQEKKEEVKSLFENLQRNELELSKEIPETSTKGHVEKIVERHLKRQKLHMRNLMKLRLSFIKCKNLFNEKQKQLNDLDNLGPNLYLIDYEQLKLTNRNLKDKVEEKENELLKVRVKCQNIMQVLAHRREKTAAVEADIPKLREEHESVCEEYEEVRAELNELKQERDDFRQRINKIKTEAGLVVRPTLMRDLQNAMSEKDKLRQNLDNMKKEYGNVVKQLSKLREYISNYEAMEDVDSDVTQKFSEVTAYVGI